MRCSTKQREKSPAMPRCCVACRCLANPNRCESKDGSPVEPLGRIDDERYGGASTPEDHRALLAAMARHMPSGVRGIRAARHWSKEDQAQHDAHLADHGLGKKATEDEGESPSDGDDALLKMMKSKPDEAREMLAKLNGGHHRGRPQVRTYIDADDPDAARKEEL